MEKTNLKYLFKTNVLSFLLSTIFIVFILLLQLSRLNFCFSGFSNIFNAHPIYQYDYPIIQYTMEMARKFYSLSGHLYGYDPFYLSGYPLTFLWNVLRIFQVLAVLLPSVPSFLILKTALFLILIIEPFILYWSFRNYKISKQVSLFIVLIILVLFRSGFVNIYLITGMLQSYSVYLLSFLVISLLYKYSIESKKRKTAVQLFILIPLTLLVHKLFLMLLFFSCIALGIYFLITKKIWKMSFVIFTFLFAFLLNSFWMIPMFQNWSNLEFSYNINWKSAGIIYFINQQIFAGNYFFSIPFFFESILLLFAIGGIYILIKKRQSWYLYFILINIITMVFLVYFSSFFSISNKAHGASHYLFLCYLIAILSSIFLDKIFSTSKHYIKYISIILILTLSTLSFYFPSYIDNSKTILRNAIPIFDYRENKTVRQIKDIADWLKKNTDIQDNIFLQQGDHNAHLYVLYSLWSGKKYISAPYKYIYLKNNYINRYLQDYFFIPKHKLKSWPQAPVFKAGKMDFIRIIKFFNIKYWVVYNWMMERKIKKIEGMRKVYQNGAYYIYKYDKKMSNIKEGSADFSVNFKEIKLKNVYSKNNFIIINMHWYDGMNVNGAESIEPYYYQDYILPFIKVNKPQKNVIIKFYN